MTDMSPTSTKEELLESFEAGDMGEVEFFELALEAGMTLKEIGTALQQAAQLDYMDKFGA
jgi:hypothetical protein